MKPSPTQSDKTVEEIVQILYNRAFVAAEPNFEHEQQAIAALTAREERMVQEALDNVIAKQVKLAGNTMNKPTIDEILEMFGMMCVREACITKEEMDDAKQQLTQLIADIIGENKLPEEYELSRSGYFYANNLRDEQRQRAKERGIEVE